MTEMIGVFIVLALAVRVLQAHLDHRAMMDKLDTLIDLLSDDRQVGA